MQLYTLLEEMFECSKKNDEKRIRELDKQYEKKCVEVYHEPLTKLDAELEGARTSCYLAVTSPKISSKFLEDAEKRMKGLELKIKK